MWGLVRIQPLAPSGARSIVRYCVCHLRLYAMLQVAVLRSVMLMSKQCGGAVPRSRESYWQAHVQHPNSPFRVMIYFNTSCRVALSRWQSIVFAGLPFSWMQAFRSKLSCCVSVALLHLSVEWNGRWWNANGF